MATINQRIKELRKSQHLSQEEFGKKIGLKNSAVSKMEQDGSTVVTMCPTCTYTYAFRLMQQPRPLENKHYTELVFENQFDWDLVFGQLNSMWSGEYGAWLAQVFA